MTRVVTPRPAQAQVQYSHWPRRLPRELAIPRTSLWFNLAVSAARYPDKPATVFLGATLSFDAMRAQAEALAGWLQAQGVGTGDRVVLFMQNCPQYLVSFYAVNRANAVVVPVNPMNREDEFGHYLTDPQTKVVICSGELAGVVAAASARLDPSQRPAAVLVTQYWQMLPPDGPAADCQVPESMQSWLTARHDLPAGAVDWRDALAQGLTPGPHTAGPDDLAMLPYTSGTTGLPKGCVHTNATLMSNSCGGCQWGYASAESVGLAVVPMFHITGTLYGVLGPIYAGMTLVIMPRWDRELCGSLISRYRVTHWTCIPTMIIDLFASPNYRSFNLTSLRYLSGGGAAMPKAVAERLLEEFGLTFAEGYGLTETAAPSHGNPPERAKLQCLGIPIFGVDSRVVDPTTLEELPVGEVGEIITHGPMVFKGYWQQPEATEAAFVELDGKRFFRTGDLGRMDEEGYFFITDRLKRMINASGYKVWPSEVEMLLYRHPAVQEACVIASKDAYRGETVKAVVVLRAEAKGKTTEQDIIAWAHEHMAPYKAPRLVSFVDALPKSGSGKVMWRLLQEQEQGQTSPAPAR
ncbi:long-chain fatty acid--CoA ligase [Roseateles depolymerans]|uniref:Acyl-CoA synthetase/AMP-acid ligase II n=1 Tax=Roseateles depolymerans TaxID=76731 RepID=A0A0U3MKN3_9BURK|nr:long-chain fatty acid--CoA ligase [Roseateles depolymerans]ALV08028.1 Acyl-CoA synthetase/AMP-acid ligase II [Roseateles depolymerans]REG21752.1 fatty-acyl-CoA synthase [Roseateles depolymerans]